MHRAAPFAKTSTLNAEYSRVTHFLPSFSAWHWYPSAMNCYGCNIYKEKVNHLLYMDDLKLYGKNDYELEGLLRTVKKNLVMA